MSSVLRIRTSTWLALEGVVCSPCCVNQRRQRQNVPHVHWADILCLCSAVKEGAVKLRIHTCTHTHTCTSTKKGGGQNCSTGRVVFAHAVMQNRSETVTLCRTKTFPGAWKQTIIANVTSSFVKNGYIFVHIYNRRQNKIKYIMQFKITWVWRENMPAVQ